jgi:predicted dehydrogenase
MTPKNRATSDPLRVAIVGCGHVGLAEHLPAVRKAGGEIVALVDSRDRVAHDAAHVHRVPYATTSLTEALAGVDFDVVAVSAPSEVHRALALEAIAAGKHLYLEKPPTRNAAEITEVVAAARAAGACMIAGSNHPFRQNVTHLRDRIASGHLGDVYAVDCFKLRRAACPVDRGTESYDQGVGFYSSVHRLDVALYLLGSPEPESVCARTYNHFTLEKSRAAGIDAPSGRVEDSIIATIHFRDGCTLTLRDIHSAHMAEPNDMQCWFGDMTIFGTHAGATLHPLTIYRTDPSDAQSIEIPSVNNDLHASHHPAYVQLFDWIRTGRAPEGTPDRAVMLMRLIDAMHASARANGRQIRFQ